MQDTLTIEISRPNNVADLEMVRRQASERAYAQAICDLVRRGIISVAYGAELLGIDLIAMSERLRESGVPVADYTAQALVEEVEDALHDFGTDPGRHD